MAIRSADGERMVEAAKKNGKYLGICFQNRYNESSKKIRSLLDSGEMGRVLGGSAVVTWDRGESYYGKAEWRGKWATEGGAVLINQAIHTFDLLRDKKILLIAGKGFNWHQPDHFRIVYLPRIEVLDEAAQKMKDFFSYYRQ